MTAHDGSSAWIPLGATRQDPRRSRRVGRDDGAPHRAAPGQRAVVRALERRVLELAVADPPRKIVTMPGTSAPGATFISMPGQSTDAAGNGTAVAKPITLRRR